MPSIAQYAPIQQSAAGTTVTTAITIINATGLNNRYRDLVSLVITTPNAAASVLTVSDGNKTVFLLNYPNAAVAPGAPLVLFFDPPIEQSGVGNAAWTITASVNASGYNYSATFLER